MMRKTAGGSAHEIRHPVHVHRNTDTEPYPHRDVHARVTREILRTDELGFDCAWLAEHHFSTEYGIMPDVFL